MKKLTALLLTGALAVSALTGCGSSSSDKAADTTDKTEEATDAAEDTADTAKAADGELTTIKVAASATPHAEILEQAKPLLAEQGYDLEVTVFEDYVQPNLL